MTRISSKPLSERQTRALQYAALQHQNGHKRFEPWPEDVTLRTLMKEYAQRCIEAADLLSNDEAW